MVRMMDEGALLGGWEGRGPCPVASAAWRDYLIGRMCTAIGSAEEEGRGLPPFFPAARGGQG